MKQNLFETVLGGFVLLIAVVFLFFSLRVADVSSSSSGYTITADFSGIGGLQKGDDVLISGVKVGTVEGIELQEDSYLARVSMMVNDEVKIPDDTAALISSESLLGGKYMLLEPGASDTLLEEGGAILYTQAPQNLEQLLGQFIFSVQSDKGDKEDTSSPEE